jgi:hypothetical protein
VGMATAVTSHQSASGCMHALRAFGLCIATARTNPGT